MFNDCEGKRWPKIIGISDFHTGRTVKRNEIHQRIDKKIIK